MRRKRSRNKAGKRFSRRSWRGKKPTNQPSIPEEPQSRWVQVYSPHEDRTLEDVLGMKALHSKRKKS